MTVVATLRPVTLRSVIDAVVQGGALPWDKAGGAKTGYPLLDYSQASITRATEAAFVDPRPPANGGTGDYSWDFVDGGVYIEHVDFDDDLTTWTAVGTPGITAGVTDPHGGTAARNVEDDDAAAFDGVQEDSGTAMRVGQTYRVTVYLGKDAITTRFPEMQFKDSANAQLHYVQLNTSTGAETTRLSSGWTSASHVVSSHDANYWKIVATLVSANTNQLRLSFLPAAGTTFGAASTAAVGDVNFYLDPTETLQNWLEPGVARIFADGAILIEEARTNVVDTSDNIDATGWAGGGTRTLNDATAPDGGTTADKITNAGTGLLDECRRYSEIASTLAVTVSAYVSLDTGSGDASIASGSAGSNGVTATATPQRISLYNSAATGSKRCEVYNLDLGGSAPAAQTGTAGDANHWWGFQMEESQAFMSSPIRTSGADATRNKDVATYTGSDAIVAAFTGDWYIDVWPLYGSTTSLSVANARVLDIGANKLSLYRSGSSGVTWGANISGTTGGGGGNIIATSPTWSAGDHLRIYVRSSPVNGADTGLRIDNLTTDLKGTANTSTAGATPYTNAHVLTVGDYNSGNFSINAVIGRPVRFAFPG